MKSNVYFFLNLSKNNFILYSSTKKRIKRNKKEKLFIMNNNFFRNNKELRVPLRSLKTENLCKTRNHYTFFKTRLKR